VDYINFKKDLTRQRLRHEIKNRVNEAHKTAKFIYDTNRGRQSSDQLKKSITTALRTIRFFDDRNYYFIDDLDGNSIMYPPKPGFEGKNLLGIVNKEGIKPFPDIIKLVKEKGEGYYIYNWVKYTEGLKPTEKEFPKITYYKHFEPFDWFIAVGEYLDYVEDDIQKEILNRIANIKFGDRGSISITTLDGKTLVSDNQVWQPPMDHIGITDINGLTLFEMQKKAAQKKEGGFFQFSIQKSKEGPPTNKISFATGLLESGLIIQANQSIDGIDQVIQLKRSASFLNARANIKKIILTAIILIFLTLIFARYFSLKTKKNFDIFKRFFKRASTQSTAIETGKLNFQEFTELADSANLMIKARHKAEMELKQLHDKLEEKVIERTALLSAANKELDAFAYSVSHDLRAPLRGIDGFSLALMEDFEDTLDDTGRNYLTRIRKGCVRMGLLIDDMLKLSRLSRGKIHKENLNLTDMATQIIDSLKTSEPDRKIAVEIDKKITARADASLIRAVLENLLGNAWKFTSKTVDAKIRFGTKEEEGMAKIFVEDNGAGFDMAYGNKLFNAFQRLHSSDDFEGTGIGLATVQRIIHRHGGSISAVGEVGKGATFYFTL
jgi:signal transduction histidine kinase